MLRCAVILSCCAAAFAGGPLKNVIVYKVAGKFGGWPFSSGDHSPGVVSDGPGKQGRIVGAT